MENLIFAVNKFQIVEQIEGNLIGVMLLCSFVISVGVGHC
jgi:hypothetical protein